MAETSSTMKRLKGKVVIITGGASGIGEATARLFADHGPQAIVIADIQDELGQEVANSIGSTPCTYYHCDVSDEDQVKALVDWTCRTFDRLDIMFSNAGIMSKSEQTILDLDLSELDVNFAVNARGMAACVKHAARIMVELQVKGSIVCTASLAASKGFHKVTDYYMSKHAVLGLVRCASKQLGEYGIRVNCVSPYMVESRMTCHALSMEAEGAEREFQGLTSLRGTALMKAKHVADAVLFLASDDSAFVTGHDLKIGGFTTSSS